LTLPFHPYVTMIELGFSRLVRYEHDGKVYFGDLQNDDGSKYTIKRLEGNLEDGFKPTSDEHTVEKVGSSLSDALAMV
jgi:hypothetical protein